MPGSTRRRAVTLTATVTALHTVVLLLATRASAAPDDDPCELIRGPAKKYCEQGEGRSGGARKAPPETPALDNLDPLASLARGFGDAASWIVNKLTEYVNDTAAVDFTNEKFLQQYAVVFAASTILTLIVWLLAVTKRAVRGVPLLTALSEAIGFLWLTVLASAFTPLILSTVVSATDGVSEVLAKSVGGDTDQFFGTFSQALDKGTDIGGGPIMLIVVSAVSIAAAGILCLELVIRAAMLYVGALLGTVVYSGLVDKNTWGRIRRWAGLMVAIILVKPIIVIVLGVAGALQGEDGPDSLSAVVSGLSVILLAIFASASIYRFIPGFGDDIMATRNNRLMRGAENRAATALNSPAAWVAQGIRTHSSRPGGKAGGGKAGGGDAPPQPATANAVGSGLSSHAHRQPGPAQNGGGSAPSAVPPPRTSPSSTPHAGDRGTNSTGGDGR
ncbi:hypothetical protein ABZ626_25275 [Streptomyces longispororuber]|uniref:hypothetical protein n=1 Tax=Streptomyces TaxID=1883 RepID=UPI0024A9A8A5|nr:hypothetical protein [Streptomyces sp. CC224B]